MIKGSQREAMECDAFSTYLMERYTTKEILCRSTSKRWRNRLQWRGNQTDKTRFSWPSQDTS